MAGEILYGFHQLTDILSERVNENNIAVVNDAIQQAQAEYNRQLDAVTGLFVTRTTEHQVRYKQLGRARSQPLDQNGRALPVKPSGYYDVAFPIHAAGNAWGTNYVTRQFMTVQDVNDNVRTMFDGDTAWMTDHILAALFADSTYTFTDTEHGSLTIQPLANGDAVTYGVFTGASSAATDDHILAQANAIADGADNPFPTIYTELTEHPENGGQVVAFIASDLKASVEGLTNFKEQADPNIRVGSGNDELVGSLGVNVPGTVIGYVDGVWIVEWPSLPSSYLIATTTEGNRPLAQREFAVPSLQGFRQVAERLDYPYEEVQYARWAGFGAWNRVGALVMRIGNGTYAVPTNYSVPMA